MGGGSFTHKKLLTQTKNQDPPPPYTPTVLVFPIKLITTEKKHNVFMVLVIFFLVILIVWYCVYHFSPNEIDVLVPFVERRDTESTHTKARELRKAMLTESEMVHYVRCSSY